jgi:hypothetical protein
LLEVQVLAIIIITITATPYPAQHRIQLAHTNQIY